MSLVAIRELLVRVCVREGFPSPAPERGVARWADEVLDVALAPKGSDAWREGHAHVIDALEAATRGSEALVEASIRAALDVVKRRARITCSCPIDSRGASFAAENKRICVKCGGIQR